MAVTFQLLLQVKCDGVHFVKQFSIQLVHTYKAQHRLRQYDKRAARWRHPRQRRGVDRQEPRQRAKWAWENQRRGKVVY